MTHASSVPAFIARLRTDQTSGASQLALHALRDCRDYLSDTAPLSWQTLADLAATLKTARPSMVPLGNAVDRWLWSLDAQATPASLKQQAIERLDILYQTLSEAAENTALHALPLIAPHATIMTHSRSSTAMRLFRHLVGRDVPFNVIVTLSGPGNEGRLVAAELARLRVPVTLVTDAQMGLFMPDVDINISGCDCWLADGAFLNKSGTYLQALAARDQGKPFWVLADSFRNSPLTCREVTLEEKDPAEVDATGEAGIRIRNVYFEPVPESLITGRVDENGAHTRARSR